MTIVDRSCELLAPADVVWNAVKTPAAFRFVTRGLISMPAIRQRSDEWHEGETIIGWVFLFRLIPFSRHHLRVEKIDDTTRTLTSREKGGLLRRWDHDIVITPLGQDKCTYRDRIEIDAGFITPVVVQYARFFYRIRQRRWRQLAKELMS